MCAHHPQAGKVTEEDRPTPRRSNSNAKLMPVVRRLVMIPHVQYSLIPGLTCAVEHSPAHPLPHMHLSREAQAQQVAAWGRRRGQKPPPRIADVSGHGVAHPVFESPPMGAMKNMPAGGRDKANLKGGGAARIPELEVVVHDDNNRLKPW